MVFRERREVGEGKLNFICLLKLNRPEVNFISTGSVRYALTLKIVSAEIKLVDERAPKVALTALKGLIKCFFSPLAYTGWLLSLT